MFHYNLYPGTLLAEAAATGARTLRAFRKNMSRSGPACTGKTHAGYPEFVNISEPILANSRAAALNENEKHDNKKHAGDDTNNGYVIHVDPLPSLIEVLVKILDDDDDRRT
jgi:hypothetical protein